MEDLRKKLAETWAQYSRGKIPYEELHDAAVNVGLILEEKGETRTDEEEGLVEVIGKIYYLPCTWGMSKEDEEKCEERISKGLGLEVSVKKN